MRRNLSRHTRHEPDAAGGALGLAVPVLGTLAVLQAGTLAGFSPRPVVSSLVQNVTPPASCVRSDTRRGSPHP